MTSIECSTHTLATLRRSSTWAACAAAALLATACVGGDGSGTGATVVDSAGLRIVTSRVPAGGVPVFGTVATEPDFELRGPGGEGQGPFTDVVGAATGADGTIAIADAASRLVSFHTPDGAPMGVETGGPGIYGLLELAALGRIPGGFWVWDTQGRRLSLLRDRTTERAFEAPPLGEVVGRFGDGSYLMRPEWSIAFHRDDPRQGIRRDTARWFRWWPESGDTATVGLFPQDEVVVAVRDTTEVWGLPPFGRATSVATGPGRLWVGDQVAFEIRGLDPDGTPRQLLRLEGTDVTLRPQQISAARPAQAPDGGPLPWWSEVFWSAVPSTRPAYTRLLLDDLGNLWVAEHVAVLDTPRTWLVFDAAGALRGLVAVPPHFALLDVTRDHLLGVTVEGGGRQVVRRYALTRSD